MQVYRSLEPAEGLLSFSIQRCGIELRIRRTPPRPIEMFSFFASNVSENAKIKVREISAKNISSKEFYSCKSSGISQNPAKFLIWILRWRWQSHQSQGFSFRVANMWSGYIKMIILQLTSNQFSGNVLIISCFTHRSWLINSVNTWPLTLDLHQCSQTHEKVGSVQCVCMMPTRIPLTTISHWYASCQHVPNRQNMS